MVLICFLLDIFKINILYFMDFCLYSWKMTALQLMIASFLNVHLHVSVLNLEKIILWWFLVNENTEFTQEPSSCCFGFFRIVKCIWDFIWIWTLKCSIVSNSDLYYKILLRLLEILATHLKDNITKSAFCTIQSRCIIQVQVYNTGTSNDNYKQFTYST